MLAHQRLDTVGQDYLLEQADPENDSQHRFKCPIQTY